MFTKPKVFCRTFVSYQYSIPNFQTAYENFSAEESLAVVLCSVEVFVNIFIRDRQSQIHSTITRQRYLKNSAKNVLSKCVKELEKYEGAVNYTAVSSSQS
jgi:hypothetical protein